MKPNYKWFIKLVINVMFTSHHILQRRIPENVEKYLVDVIWSQVSVSTIGSKAGQEKRNR